MKLQMQLYVRLWHVNITEAVLQVKFVLVRQHLPPLLMMLVMMTLIIWPKIVLSHRKCVCLVAHSTVYIHMYVCL